ncbi:MAG: sulfotransferase family 2 domain-containing protein [Flavobacteriales bacterium]|nr:sulfotransferase family 2 domain-containing protein [Flavobacteriales bacterium]
MKKLKTQLSRFKRRVLKGIFKGYDLVMDSDKYIRYTHYTNGFHNPNYHFKKDQIAFVHIPKTGGTTLNRMLEESDDSRFVNLGIHKPVSLACKVKNYQYFTVIRNPVDRVWSQYQMVLRSDKEYPYKKFADRGLDVFLKKCWAVRNMTCRYLTGEIETEPNDETLKNAMQNLSSFYAILSFQSFSEEISEFLKEHKVPFTAIPNERESSYAQPSETEIELIKKYNKLDMTLFEKWSNKDLITATV